MSASRVATLLAALGHGEGCSYAATRRTRGEGSRSRPWALCYLRPDGRHLEPVYGGRNYTTHDEAMAAAVPVLEALVERAAVIQRDEAAAQRDAATSAAEKAQRHTAHAEKLEAVLRGEP